MVFGSGVLRRPHRRPEFRLARHDHLNPIAGPFTASAYTLREALLAQLVEQLTLNQRVVGSSPTAPTKEKRQIGFRTQELRGFERAAGVSRAADDLHDIRQQD